MITITTLPPPENTTWRMTKDVFNAAGFAGSITLMGPRSELEPQTSPLERVLYLVEGAITADLGDTNYILHVDDSLVVPANRTVRLRNNEKTPAKVLTLSLPQREAAPEIVMFR